MSMREVIESIEREMFDRATREENTKNICQGNPNCKNAEHRTVAIDVTTYGDLADNTKRYIKGTGERENE